MTKKKEKKIMAKTEAGCCDHKKTEQDHPDHAQEFNRMNRIMGQLSGVKKMIDERAYCPEILIQTKAIRSAIMSLELSILNRHLHHCVHSAFTSKDNKDIEAKIQELLDIFKKSNV